MPHPNPSDWSLLAPNRSAISDSPADTIVDIAATVGASYLIVGAPQRNALVNLLRGNIIRSVSSILPEEIHLAVGSSYGQIKTGSLCRSERVAKYNRLVTIAF
jgi:hypothetical protein